MLTKVIVGEKYPNTKLHPLLSLAVIEHFIPNAKYFTNGKLVIIDKANFSLCFISGKLKKVNKIEQISIKFPTGLIWKNINSFNENDYYSCNLLRKSVLSYFYNSTEKTLIGHSGESYAFQCFLPQYENYYFYAKNIDQFKDSTFNMKLHLPNKNISISHVKDIIPHTGDIIIGLFNINNDLICYLNNNNFNKVCIVTCGEKSRERIKKINYNIKKVKSFVTTCVIVIYFMENKK